MAHTFFWGANLVLGPLAREHEGAPGRGARPQCSDARCEGQPPGLTRGKPRAREALPRGGACVWENPGGAGGQRWAGSPVPRGDFGMGGRVAKGRGVERETGREGDWAVGRTSRSAGGGPAATSRSRVQRGERPRASCGLSRGGQTSPPPTPPSFSAGRSDGCRRMQPSSMAVSTPPPPPPCWRRTLRLTRRSPRKRAPAAPATLTPLAEDTSSYPTLTPQTYQLYAATRKYIGVG